MNRVEINVQTGEKSTIALTQAEIDASVAAQAQEVIANNVTKVHQYDFVAWCVAQDALDAGNRIETLNTIIESSTANKLLWSGAVHLENDNPLVVGAAPALGIADLQATFNEIGAAS